MTNKIPDVFITKHAKIHNGDYVIAWYDSITEAEYDLRLNGFVPIEDGYWRYNAENTELPKRNQ